MLPAALEHERLLIAERLLSEIERRHGLPHPIKREIHPVIIDRFLAAYLPEAREGEPAPLALEYAFSEALISLRRAGRSANSGPTAPGTRAAGRRRPADRRGDRVLHHTPAAETV